jgi:hypothetical protein
LEVSFPARFLVGGRWTGRGKLWNKNIISFKWEIRKATVHETLL